mgnify:CR=1 FL=1
MWKYPQGFCGESGRNIHTENSPLFLRNFHREIMQKFPCGWSPGGYGWLACWKDSAMISGQNANGKTQLPKTPIQKMLAPIPKPRPPNPKDINQWHFIHSRFVRGIQTGHPQPSFWCSYPMRPLSQDDLSILFHFWDLIKLPYTQLQKESNYFSTTPFHTQPVSKVTLCGSSWSETPLKFLKIY